MEGAVYRGIYNISSTAVFNCTSTCVWTNSYVSLGFASWCDNVTAATLPTVKYVTPASPDTVHISMTTPGGVAINASFTKTDWQTVINVVANDLMVNVFQSERATPSKIVRIAVLRTPITNPGEYTISVDSLDVTECTVGLAAYNYSGVSASGNRFSAETVDVIPLDSGIYQDLDYGMSPFVVFNQTGLPVMKAMMADIGTLIQLFTSARFSGSIYDGESVPANPVGVGLALLKGNVSDIFQNMAKSMTDQLRSSYNATAHGLTVNSVVFVSVQWVWLLFLFFIQMAALLLLVLTSWSTKKHHLPLWKSSILAMLYHEVVFEGAAEGTLRTDVRDTEQLEELARLTIAKLE